MILTLTHNYLKKHMLKYLELHITQSGLVSITNLAVGGLLTKLSIIAGLIFGSIGAIVGLITIYTFLEKKGLLPKWLIIKDKQNKN